MSDFDMLRGGQVRHYALLALMGALVAAAVVTLSVPAGQVLHGEVPDPVLSGLGAVLFLLVPFVGTGLGWTTGDRRRR